MSGSWWGKEATKGDARRAAAATAGRQLELVPATRQAIAESVKARIASFTPDWTNRTSADAGVALIQLFGEQTEPALQRLNRLPEKGLVEFLSVAGVQPLPATAARVLLEFQISDTATESVFVPAGFQVGAPPADNTPDMVVFETERSFFAAAMKIDELHAQQGNQFQDLGSDPSVEDPLLPFGNRPSAGNALWIGLSGETVPSPTITLAVSVSVPAGAPPPVPAGGVMQLPIGPRPLLGWDVLDGTTLKRAEIVIDETSGLNTSGVIELELPRTWATGRPRGMTGDAQLRWLRLRIEHGEFTTPPKLSFIKLNVTRAIAARSVRNETLEPVPNSDGRRWRLSQTPVLPDTLIVEVDEGQISIANTIDSSSPAGDAESSVARWSEVDELAAYSADDRVFTLDPLTGIVTFGDGVNGAAVPPGFRHITAARYKAGGGNAGAIDAESASTLLSSAPFVSGVTNPLPASGGRDRESQNAAVIRGPQEIRSRRRAVTVADYALIASRTQGAQVERAHAVAGLHPSYPGNPIPGVVGVFVVPPDRGDGPPVPDQETLRAVAEFLSSEASPAGVEIVAASPRYQLIRTEVGILIDPAADAGEVIRIVSRSLTNYFHPLTGGEDKKGWPFGGAIRYPALLRLVSGVEGVRAVGRLNVVIDGFRIASCTDYLIPPDSLLWPEGNNVTVMEEEVEI